MSIPADSENQEQTVFMGTYQKLSCFGRCAQEDEKKELMTFAIAELRIAEGKLLLDPRGIIPNN